MSGNNILAEPTTLTGSIGVVFGNFNLAGFHNLLVLLRGALASAIRADTLTRPADFAILAASGRGTQEA